MDTEEAKQQALALADQVVAQFRAGAVAPATQLLEAALGHICQLADRAWECDLLGRFGLAALAAGQGPQALDLFQREHTLAAAIGHLPAESAALVHLAHAAAGLNDARAALDYAGQGATIAGKLGDGKDEADLLWLAVVLHADRGQHDLAITQARAAVMALGKFSHPETSWFADQLQRYAADPAATTLGQAPEAVAAERSTTSARGGQGRTRTATARSSGPGAGRQPGGGSVPRFRPADHGPRSPGPTAASLRRLCSSHRQALPVVRLLHGPQGPPAARTLPNRAVAALKAVEHRPSAANDRLNRQASASVASVVDLAVAPAARHDRYDQRTQGTGADDSASGRAEQQLSPPQPVGLRC